ncbi:MAG TPA: periplasmic heavy metal sensor [Draconibacterium sp.]|nr:periplasmic heavy metal sensor [Draconibacterium sp.]
MIKTTTYRTLIWVVVILLATNLSMGISFLYHKQQDKKLAEQTEENAIEMPAQQRTKFLREQLNLTPQQVDKFREWNREFNRNGWDITHQLENLRVEMVLELGKETPDETRLENISKEIGELHARLKQETIGYYLKMKSECNEEQNEKLNEIFMSMLKQNEDVKLPGGYGRKGRGFRNNN